MTKDGIPTKWIRLSIAAALATSVGVVLNTATGQAALDYDPGAPPGPGQLTRFQIDGDAVETLTSDPVNADPNVLLDWDSAYGPQPPATSTGVDAPLGVGSTGLLPLVFSDRSAIDHPFDPPSDALNPQYPAVPGASEFCPTGEDDNWEGGTKVQSLVDIDNPLWGPGGTLNLGCGQTLDKGNLFEAYTAYEIVSVPTTYGVPTDGSQNHVVLYGAWRRGAVPGELNFYIPISDGTPGNTSGDRLIAFDYDSSAAASFRILSWNGSAWVVDNSGTVLNSSTTFQAAVGFANGDAFGQNDKPDFGEFALDLTAAGILPADGSECVSLRTSGYIFTETGNSANAQLKDYVLAPSLPIGNCGSFEVYKEGPTVASSPQFPYRVEQEDNQVIRPPSEIVINDTITIDQDPTDLFTGVLAQTDYLVFEPDSPPYELDPGWEQVSVDCTYIDQYSFPFVPTTANVYNGDATQWVPGEYLQVQSDAFLELTGNVGFVPSCTITNSFTGFNVTKAGDGDTDQVFDITVDSVAVDPALTIDDTTDLIPTTAGQIVTIDEPTLPAATPGWLLDSIVCSDSNGPIADLAQDLSPTSVQFAAVSGEAVNCVVTNNQQARIVVEKTADPADTTDTFDFQFAAGPSTVADITGIGHGDSQSTGDIGPGTYTITEVLPAAADPAWALTSVVCGGVDVTATVADPGVAVAAGETLTCTFTNTQDGRVVVEKQTVNGDDTFSFTGDVSGDITTSGGAGTTTLSADVAPGDSPFSVSETPTAGYALTDSGCDDLSAVDAIDVSAGETVTCTFTNTRNQATFTLDKAWGADTLAGQAVDLDASIQSGAAPNAQTIDTSSTAPAGAAAVNSMTVYSNQTVRFDEAFTVGDPNAYTTSLSCVDAAGAPISITADGDDRGGTYDTGNVPVDVTCTFANTPKVSGIALQKSWVDAKTGDAASLSASASPSGDSDGATSTAPAAPSFVGPDDATDNTAFVDVQAGDTVTFTEDLGAAGVNYTTTFSCPAATNAPVQGADSREWTLLVDTADVTAGETIFCTFANTRISADLTVEKDWVDAVGGDAVSITTTGADNDVDFSSTAGAAGAVEVTETDTDPSAPVTVYAGETLIFSEAFTTGDANAYTPSFACTGAGDTATDEALTIAAGDADANIVCTYTNTRRTADVVVEKDLVPSTDDGTFDLSIDGVEVVTGGGDGANNALAPVTVFVGDEVSLAEVAGAGSPALANYTTTVSCDNGVSLSTNNDTDGAFTVPSSLADDAVITCTFVNTRKQANLTLTKDWGSSPVDDEVVGLTISGGLDAAPVAGTNYHDDGTLADVDAQSVVYFGESGITLTEEFTAGVPENYNIGLACVGDNGTPLIGGDDLVFTVAPGASDLTGSIDIPSDLAAGSTITCTFTNDRKSADLLLRKQWYAAAVGDAAVLNVSGELGQTPGQETSTVLVAATSIFDSINTATLKVYAGETVTMTEDLGAGGSKYNSTLQTGTLPEGQCANATNASSGSARSWTLPIVAADDGAEISCTFENRRKALTLQLDKDWLQSPANGDAVDMTLTGGFATAAPGSVGDPATDSNNDTADDEVGSITAYFGETITLAEVFAAGGLDDTHYTADLSCGVAGEFDNLLTYTAGALTGDFLVDPTDQLIVAAEDGTITCTFANERKSTTLNLAKTWVGAVLADEVDLSIDATNDDLGVLATAPSGDGTSPEAPASITVYAGETVTLSEAIDPNGTNTANYNSSDFTCSAGTETPAPWAAGDISVDLSVSAGDVTAPIDCSFENTAERGTIVIAKTIDGVADGTFQFSGDWSADGTTITPATVTDPSDFPVATSGLAGSVVFENVLVPKAGDAAYTVTETDPTPLFDGTTVTCAEDPNGDGGSGPVDGTTLPLTGSIDLDEGETVTCTFTNTERSTIIIVKDVRTFDGGPLVSDQPFTFTADYSVDPIVLNDDGGVDAIPNSDQSALLNAENGASYTVTEADEFGWTLDPLLSSCTNGDSFDATGVTITPAPGTTVTCTFVNTANPAGLTATKSVENQVGPWGPFTFTLTGGPIAAGETNSQQVDSVDAVAQWTELLEGETYTLVEESPVPGYQLGTFACLVSTGAAPVGLPDADLVTDGFQFIAVAGAVYDCDITNTAIPSDVEITKTVDGGLLAGVAWSFDFTIDGVPVGETSPKTASGSGSTSETVGWSQLVPGTTYTVAEVVPNDGFTAGVLTCSGVTDTDQTADGSVTFVAPLGGDGVEVSCSIANTAQSDVTQNKVVDSVTRDAGSGVWTISYLLTVENAADAGNGVYDLDDEFNFGGGVSIVADSATVANTAPGTITTNALFDGVAETGIVVGELIEPDTTHTYRVTVQATVAVGPDTDGDCITTPGDGTGFLNTMTITVDAGDPETTEACDGFAQLTLVKDVSNDDGGNATVADFPLTAAGPATLTGVSGTATVSSAVPAGTYALSEDQLVDGYIAGAWSCDGGDQVDADVALIDGDNVTCTIVNDDEPVDLEITKNDDGVTAIAGGAPFDYTITVQNVGTRDVDLSEPVTVTDQLPVGLTWVSFPANCAQAGQTLTCDIEPALLPFGGTPVVITATVSADADAISGTYVNKASVTTDDDPVCVGVDCDPPPCPALDNNNVDCEETPVDRQGEIQIVKTDGVADGIAVEPGDTYSYELAVTNIGESTILPGLVVDDDLPGQLGLIGVDGGAGWTCNDTDPIECTYSPALAPGASAPAITVVVEVVEGASGTSIVNVAEVIGAVDRDCETDRLIEAFEPACNQVTDDDDEVTPLNPNADLAIVKTASVDQIGAGAGAGGEFDWKLEITNNGPGTAVNVEIGDLVPAAVSVTKVTSSDFNCSNDGNAVTCTKASMVVGESGTVTITVTTETTTESVTVVNVGTVESDTPDPDLTNNSDDASVIIVKQVPPTTLPPVTLPETGSDATGGILQTGLLLLVLGGVTVLVTRRRRDEELNSTI